MLAVILLIQRNHPQLFTQCAEWYFTFVEGLDKVNTIAVGRSEGGTCASEWRENAKRNGGLIEYTRRHYINTAPPTTRPTLCFCYCPPKNIVKLAWEPNMTESWSSMIELV